MTEQTETYIDRSEWPSGPWDNEPDKVVWVDEETDLDCMIVRTPHQGHLCGYVGVPAGHPWHGKEYDECRTGDGEWPEVHGGLTYANPCQEEGRICHVPRPGRPKDVWWLGFDCMHLHDASPTRDDHRFDPTASYKNVGYVRAEVKNLALQAKEAASR